MKKEFFEGIDRNTYTQRDAGDQWKRTIAKHIDLHNKTAADIGAGGGIYSIALAELGAEKVIAIDASQNMLESARQNCSAYPNIEFQLGSAEQTNLEDSAVDIILERALIHHLDAAQLKTCFQEAGRILNENGSFIIQDRTKEDCLVKGSPEHIRGYFFEIFPELKQKDTERRHSLEAVNLALYKAGFSEIELITLWEDRKTYETAEELKKEILMRKGRSILFELDDNEIEVLAEEIQKKAEGKYPIHEKERWTIWIAKK